MRNVDYVQESVVEHLTTKQAVVREIDRHTPSGVLIASSSSFLPYSLVSLHCAVAPSRIVTAHPSLPQWDSFVEVLGQTPAQTTWLSVLFRRCGMDVLALRNEYPGHVLNSLTKAISDQSVYMVARGHCSAADVDKAAVHLCKLIVANEGLAGTLVGTTGGGSVQAARSIAADSYLAYPLVSITCMTKRWLHDGPVSRGVIQLLQLLFGWVGWAYSKLLVLRLVDWIAGDVFARWRHI